VTLVIRGDDLLASTGRQIQPAALAGLIDAARPIKADGVAALVSQYVRGIRL